MEPIRSQYEDDPDMLELVEEFAAELPDRISALEDVFGRGELSELQRLAHQLKGAGGGYGFPQITDVAATLEAAVNDGAQEGIVKERMQALCETLRAVTVPERA